MHQFLIYLGLVRDPASTPITLPWWAWLLVGMAVTALITGLVKIL